MSTIDIMHVMNGPGSPCHFAVWELGNKANVYVLVCTLMYMCLHTFTHTHTHTHTQECRERERESKIWNLPKDGR